MGKSNKFQVSIVVPLVRTKIFEVSISLLDGRIVTSTQTRHFMWHMR